MVEGKRGKLASRLKIAQSQWVSSYEFVRVAPELGLDRLFDYRIPERLRGQVGLGQRLRVPWGRRSIMAYAVEFPDQPEVEAEKVREVEEVAASAPLFLRLCAS